MSDFRAADAKRCKSDEDECCGKRACACSVKCVGDEEREADGCLEDGERKRGRRDE